MNLIKTYNTHYNQDIYSFEDYISRMFLLQNKFYDIEICSIISFIINYYNNVEKLNILDIGGNIGLIPIGINNIIRKLNTKTNFTIHSFEPVTTTFELLKHNCKQHSNVRLYPFAISNKFELCNITNCIYNSGGFYIDTSIDGSNINKYNHPDNTPDLEIKDKQIFFPAIPLDNISYLFDDKIAIIKIDIEGYELNALKGSINIINKHRPIIIIEIWEKNLLDCFVFFQNIHYNIHKISSCDNYYDENYIAIPCEFQESFQSIMYNASIIVKTIQS